ncbi:AI-2E family transporter [Candidatus Poribacteria bacterium]|nr:AI-2E family transporter [Candidatus Poribacteria bacterium]
MDDPKPTPVFVMDPQMRRVALMIGYMIIVAGFAYAVTVLWPAIQTFVGVMAPFLVALVVAYLVNPVVNFVQRKLKLTRVGGVIVLNLAALLIIGGFIALIVPTLANQCRRAYDGIAATASDKVIPWFQRGEYARFIPGMEVPPPPAPGAQTQPPRPIKEVIHDWLLERNLTVDSIIERALGREEVLTAATEGAGLLGRVVTAVARGIAEVIGSIIFLVFAGLVSFYLLLDFASFRGIAEVICPDKFEPRLFDILAKVDQAVGGFIRGQIISALLVGLLTFAGLLILGMKQYALLIGCIATIGNMVPYLGPVVGATPAVLYMLLSDDHETLKWKLIYSGSVIALFGFIQFIDGFVFQPKIVGKGAQLHPVVVIIALVLGAQFGIMGMILAVPTACIARVLLKEFYWDKRYQKWQQTTGKGHLDA